MQKLKSLLNLKKLDSKAIATVGIFTALTVVFTIISTIRIGNQIEISLKFVPVFVLGALYGPIYAALASLLGDIISVILFPAGAPIIGMFFTELLSGFTYGILFYKKYNLNASYIVRLVLCVLIQLFLSLFLNSLFLTAAGYFSSLSSAVTIRSAASLSKLVLQALVIFFAPYYLKAFSKLV